jgi:hypothetical protein
LPFYFYIVDSDRGSTELHHAHRHTGFTETMLYHQLRFLIDLATATSCLHSAPHLLLHKASIPFFLPVSLLTLDRCGASVEMTYTLFCTVFSRREIWQRKVCILYFV